MRVCIFSDVHANLPALETFVEVTKGLADAWVCLGDVVDYGPWNDECLGIVHALPNAVVLEGNHERLFLGKDPIDAEIELVRDFFSMSFASFTRRDLIEGLPTRHTVGNFVCTHTIDGRKIYADTTLEVAGNWFIGHTHHAFRIERRGSLVVNCGSVGQSRSGGDVLGWALYDTADQRVTLHEAPYPADRFVNELVARGYPQRCIDYYRRIRTRRRAESPRPSSNHATR